MSTEVRVYDNEHGDPVVVTTGTHDEVKEDNGAG